MPSKNEPDVLGGMRSRLDLIAPDGISMPDDPPGYRISSATNLSYIQFGHDRFCRSFVVTDFPRQVWVGVLRDFDMLGDVDRSIHIYVPDQARVVSDLTAEIRRLETEAYARGTKISETDAVLGQAIADTKELRDLISLGHDKMFYVTAIITISAPTLEELDRKTKMLYEICGEKLMYVRELFMRQDEGIKATLPLADNQVADVYRNMNIGATTALFPFDAQDLSDSDGIFLGENLFTGAPVFFNNFKQELESSHTCILGRTGSGKTTTVMAMILRSAAQGVANVVLDPEGEYKDVIERVGGQYIVFRANMTPAINPLDLEEEERIDGTRQVDVLSKVEEAKGLFLYMMSGLDSRFPISPEEEAMLEQALLEEYASRGITNDPASLYEPDTRNGRIGLKKKEMPTISSVCERLDKMFGEKANRIILRLKPYCQGGTMAIFDGQTTLDIKNVPAVGFGLSALDNSELLKYLTMYVLTHYIWQRFVKKNPKKRKRVIVDEAWMFCKNIHSLRFFELMARRARKRNCSLLVSSQSFREFLPTDEGRAVLQSAAVVLLMKQSVTDLDDLANLYRLPRGQLNFLIGADKGQGLLRMSAGGSGGQAFTSHVTGVQVRIMPHEEPYIFHRKLVS